MKTSVAAALIAAAALAPQANASTVGFKLSGGPFSGSGFFTVAPDVAPPDPNTSCGTVGNNACRTDPAGAYMITNISGTFSDTADSISNANITGLVSIDPESERDPTFDPLVPSSLSFFDFTTALPSEDADFSYDNLLFPQGSPLDCSTFNYTGTAVDVYGVAFTVDGGYTVDLWGDGDLNGPGTTTYGVGVVDGSGTEIAYQFAGVNARVPEPGSLVLLATGLIGLLVWRRRAAG